MEPMTLHPEEFNRPELAGLIITIERASVRGATVEPVVRRGKD
jgi:hypothetical protein